MKSNIRSYLRRSTAMPTRDAVASPSPEKPTERGKIQAQSQQNNLQQTTDTCGHWYQNSICAKGQVTTGETACVKGFNCEIPGNLLALIE